MNSSDTNFASAINDIKGSMVIFIEVWSFTFIVFGVVGHALSIYTFTRPKFRLNPCVYYLLAATLSGYPVVCFTVPLRLLQINYNIDVYISSTLFCKIVIYALVSVRVLPSWFNALACIDRFLCSSSSATLRAWSNVRVASRAIPITVLFIGLVYIHIPFNYAILLPQRSCTFVSSDYQAFFAIFNLFFWSWIPSVCMLVFGLLIIRQIRQGRRRVAPQNHVQRHHKKTDRQLIQMLLFQSFVLGLTTTLQSIGYLYISITSNLRVKNALDNARDSYISNALNYVALTGPCMSFYIFTLSSQMFRHELIKLFRRELPAQNINNINTRNTQQLQN